MHTLWIREIHADSEAGAIWALATSERWNFTIFPNGDVRFTPLTSNQNTTDAKAGI
jgi:hypothetical protein